jgi:nucleotide-binding universal stress UspA family protein
MKELVVGLDGSRDSRRALRWAAAVADRAAVPVRAIEAWSYPALAVMPGWSELVSPAEMDERTVDGIRAVVASVLGDVPDFVTTEARRGPAARAILGAVDPDSVILVGKDRSENSARALEWAGTIGQLTGAAVVAVYAWQVTSAEVRPQLHRRLRAEAGSTVEGWIAQGTHPAASVEAEGDPGPRSSSSPSAWTPSSSSWAAEAPAGSEAWRPAVSPAIS